MSERLQSDPATIRAAMGWEENMPDPDKFWGRVLKADGCWEWQGSHTTGGYANLRLPSGKTDYAHRISYRFTVGPIPAGMHIDHLCRNRGCVRPEHLEVVTPAENFRRGAGPYGEIRTKCKHGHDITNPLNVYTDPKGSHRCRVCAAALNSAKTEMRRARGDKRKILKTHCRRGHPFDEANTYISATGTRACRACRHARYLRMKGEK